MSSKKIQTKLKTLIKACISSLKPSLNLQSCLMLKAAKYSLVLFQHVSFAVNYWHGKGKKDLFQERNTKSSNNIREQEDIVFGTFGPSINSELLHAKNDIVLIMSLQRGARLHRLSTRNKWSLQLYMPIEY